jgi:hypothetical protein
MPRDSVDMLGEAVWGLVGGVLRGSFRGGMFLYRRSVLCGARRRATHNARVAERASRKQQQKWFEDIEQQKARGDAGFASEDEAQVALRGKGGRPSKLDDQWF